MRFGCCAPPERMAAVKRAGYDYVETTVARTLRPETPEPDYAPVRRQITDAGIPVQVFNVFLPADLRVVGVGVDLPRLTAYLDTAIGRMKELKGRVVVFGSGGARTTPEGFDRRRAREQIVSFLRMVGPKLGAANITLAIEPLYKPACDNINTVAEALEIVQETNHPRITVLADWFHMVHEEEPLSNLARAGGALRHVHVPVPPLEGKAPKPWDSQYTEFLDALAATGYDRRISVEDNGGRFEDFESEAGKALAYLKSKWAA